MMNTKKILIHTFALSAIVLPVVALAHGGNGDGHIDADGHKVGSSELLVALSARWWGIMAVAVILMSALSFGVWKYLQVDSPKPTTPEKKN